MSERKTGENFRSDKADDIFDKLKNVEGKVKPKRKGKFDNITYLMQEARHLEEAKKYDEAVKLYNEIIFVLPDSSKAYEGLVNIYQKQGDDEALKNTLKKAIAGCSKNEEFKKKLGEI